MVEGVRHEIPGRPGVPAETVVAVNVQVAGAAADGIAAFDDGHLYALLTEQRRRRQAGDSGSDHDGRARGVLRHCLIVLWVG